MNADEIDEKAREIVAKAVGEVTLQRAMAAALMRYAGNALAALTSHEDAGLRHSNLAGRHFQRMKNIPGRRRR